MTTPARAFEIHGHRGARGLFPENTLPGFAAAIARGVRIFELDVAVTADDVVVVTHDPCLNPDLTRDRHGRWLSGRGPLIRDLRFDQLAPYDVGRLRPGSAYAAAFSDQVPSDGARIPRLREVFALGSQAIFDIELKTFPDHPDWTVPPERMAALVVAEAEASAAASRIIIQSFDWRGPRHVRQHHPVVAVAWLTAAQPEAERSRWWDGVSPAAHGGSVARAVAAEAAGSREPARWVPRWSELSRDVVAQAQVLGLHVVPWDVNTRPQLARALDWGVDGVITDRPDWALELLRDAA